MASELPTVEERAKELTDAYLAQAGPLDPICRRFLRSDRAAVYRDAARIVRENCRCAVIATPDVISGDCEWCEAADALERKAREIGSE